MLDPEQKKKAEAFRAMHTGTGAVLLPNVWDVASARIIEEAGFQAIATTSAGIAFAQGFPDGQKIPADQMITTVAHIASAVRVPVTADVEAGYGQRPEDAARTACNVIDAGAVGMNFEDATGDSDSPLTELTLQLERLRAIRETAEELRVPIVLNARTDVYLLQIGDPSQRYDEAVQHYLVALRSDPANVSWLVGVGVALEGVGKQADAAEAYRRAEGASNLTHEMAVFVSERLARLRISERPPALTR